MHFGIFLEESRRGAGEAQAFRETLELADAAEAWGLDGVWLGEIHFNPARSVQSAPLARGVSEWGRPCRSFRWATHCGSPKRSRRWITSARGASTSASVGAAPRAPTTPSVFPMARAR